MEKTPVSGSRRRRQLGAPLLWMAAAVIAALLAAHISAPGQTAAQPGPLESAAAPAEPIPGCTYFPETGHNLCAGFLRYWEQFGGLAIFGYPLTEEYRDPETGLTTQWFERARFEWHPGTYPERHDVLLGLLGRELVALREGSDPTFPTGPFSPAGPNPGCLYFAETGHNLCAGFRAYWERFGGLAVFGYPISEEFTEVNPDTGQTYVVQYFERQRFEWHPGEWPERYDVLLGRLGAQLLAQRLAPSSPAPTPTPEPVVPPEDARLSLEPTSGINPVGAEYTVTARVEAGGQPVENVRVTFVVTGGGNPEPAAGEVLTDASGQARFTFTNDQPVTNIVRGFIDLNGDGDRDPDEPQDRATTRWLAGSLTVRPDPMATEAEVGDATVDATATLVVRDERGPAEGIPVLLEIRDSDTPSGTRASASFAACPVNDDIAPGATDAIGQFSRLLFACGIVDDGVNDTVTVNAYWDSNANGQLDRDLDVLLDLVTFTVDDRWARTTAARRVTGRAIGRPVSSTEWLGRLRRSGV